MEPNSIDPAAAAAATATYPATELDRQQVAERRDLVKAVKAINATNLFGENYELTFILDRDSKRPVMRIVDRQTKEVIRQLPPEYALRIAADLKGE